MIDAVAIAAAAAAADSASLRLMFDKIVTDYQETELRVADFAGYAEAWVDFLAPSMRRLSPLLPSFFLKSFNVSNLTYVKI